MVKQGLFILGFFEFSKLHVVRCEVGTIIADNPYFLGVSILPSSVPVGKSSFSYT